MQTSQLKRPLAALIFTSSLLTFSVPAAQAGDLPVTVPQLQEPVTGQVIGPAPKFYPEAPVPKPFTTDYLTGYVSDLSSYDFGVYWEVVRLYDFIKSNRADVVAENLEKSVAINNAAAANPSLVSRAQKDAVADTEGVMEAVSGAMGQELGQSFRSALAENRLPKTSYLLGNGYAARAGGLASSTFAEKYYFNNKRPYQVAPGRINKYPVAGQDLYLTSPSFPSGHTNQAAWITTLMAFMLPEVGPQLIYRGAQAGESRVIMGVHYPLDVIGGRMTGQAAAADRLNDPKMKAALKQASQEIRTEIQWRTGKTVGELVSQDPTVVPTAQLVELNQPLQGYGFTPTYRINAPMIVPQAAPVLLEAAYPELSWEQRRELLRLTADPAGNPLDWQGPDGSWQRINLVKALAATPKVLEDGSLKLI